MLKRFISVVVALPLLFYFVLKGGSYLVAAAAIVSLVGLFEFYNAFHHYNRHPINWMGYLFTIVLFGLAHFRGTQEMITFSLFIFIVLMLGYNVFSPKHTVEDIAITVLGFFYISFSFVHIVWIDQIDNNFFIWFVFIIAWVSDTAAYFTGYFLGSRKLIPAVSPKKTVEGAIGGVIGAVLASYLFAYLLNPGFLLYAIPLGFFGSIISQIGDLIASKIKRVTGIKDFGKIMPGHGGVLDRFDSIVLSGPLVYYIAVLFLNTRM